MNTLNPSLTERVKSSTKNACCIYCFIEAISIHGTSDLYVIAGNELST